MTNRKSVSVTKTSRLSAAQISVASAAVFAIACGSRFSQDASGTADPANYLPAPQTIEAVLYAEMLYAEGAYDEAIAAFERALSSDGPDDNLNARIVDAKQQKSLSGGAPSVEKPASENTLGSAAANRLSTEGRAVAADGDDVKGVLFLTAALRRDPGRSADRLLLVELLLKQGLETAAIRHIDSLPAPDDNVSAVRDRALLLVRADQFDKARELILDFWGGGLPSEGELRSILVAAECALGRPEIAFVIEGCDVSDADAPRECAFRIDALRETMIR